MSDSLSIAFVWYLPCYLLPHPSGRFAYFISRRHWRLVLLRPRQNILVVAAFVRVSVIRLRPLATLDPVEGDYTDVSLAEDILTEKVGTIVYLFRMVSCRGSCRISYFLAIGTGRCRLLTKVSVYYFWWFIKHRISSRIVVVISILPQILLKVE